MITEKGGKPTKEMLRDDDETWRSPIVQQFIGSIWKDEKREIAVGEMRSRSHLARKLPKDICRLLAVRQNFSRESLFGKIFRFRHAGYGD